MENKIHSQAMPFIRIILLMTDKTKPIYGQEIVDMINNKIHLDRRFTQIDLRKTINHMRKTSQLPIVAGQKGYYVSFDKEDISAQIQSLQSRINSLNEAKQGLQSLMNTEIDKSNMIEALL